MLHADLIEMINNGNTWAFIGSGISIDSGGPSWKLLVERSIIKLGEELRDKIKGDREFKLAFDRELYEKCFKIIERHAGRDRLEEVVKTQLRLITDPGPIAQMLAEWPFVGYITTNYDNLIETALQSQGEKGWTSIGNTPEEVRKLAGDPTRVVWHIHGSIYLPMDKSKFILTENDYDDLYLEDSPTVKQIKGLLVHRRVVFVGFGFNDSEIIRLLKLVRRISNPIKPGYAFFSGLYDIENKEERKELLEKYNIEVIPYRVQSGSHKKLIELLETYNAFILRRSLRFGRPERHCPSYNSETTGLLIYNHLALKGEASLERGILGCLLRARILSILKHQGSTNIATLTEDLRERVSIVNGKASSSSDCVFEIEIAVRELMKSNYIAISTDSKGQEILTLTSEGFEFVDKQVATSEKMSDQFSSSIKTRAFKLSPIDSEAATRIARAAESFLKECAQKRALGLSMV